MNIEGPRSTGKKRSATETKSLPTQEQLDQAWIGVEAAHKKYLARHGVKLPSKDEYTWIHLAMLYHFKDHDNPFVHKDLISDAVRRVFPTAARDQQVRHLKGEGWALEGPRGYHAIREFHRVSTTFQNDKARRAGRLDDATFDQQKKAFGSRCATCGANEGEPDPRYGDELVVLQRGHRDPAKPANKAKNIIPQCQFCNRSYKNDFVFDEKGRVRAIASLAPVNRASDGVKNDVRAWAKWFGSGPPGSDAR